LPAKSKGAEENDSQKPADKNEQVAEAEQEKEGQMSERQAAGAA